MNRNKQQEQKQAAGRVVSDVWIPPKYWNKSAAFVWGCGISQDWALGSFFFLLDFLGMFFLLLNQKPAGQFLGLNAKIDNINLEYYWNPGMVHNLKKYIVIQMTDAQLFEIILISNLKIDAILQEHLSS